MYKTPGFSTEDENMLDDFAFYQGYFDEVKKIAGMIDHRVLENIIDVLYDTKNRGGRVFILGLGGSASNASHMSNDLRKFCGMQCYSPTDNIADITATANDVSFDMIFSEWLYRSNLTNKDCLFIMSVSGGNELVSSGAIKNAIDYAHDESIDAMVLGICGDPSGYLSNHGDYVVQVPMVNPAHKYQHAESFQGIIWHCLISHPDLVRITH